MEHSGQLRMHYTHTKEPIMPFDFAPLVSQRQFLPGRRSLKLDDAQGTVIAVESGCLWVTMENDTRDVILMPGMRFEVDRSGRTIIAAEEDSRFGLLAPSDCAEGIAASIARKLATVFDRWASRRASGFVPYY
jgi:Protein of unknown function (DUF2917)